MFHSLEDLRNYEEKINDSVEGKFSPAQYINNMVKVAVFYIQRLIYM